MRFLRVKVAICVGGVPSPAVAAVVVPAAVVAQLSLSPLSRIPVTNHPKSSLEWNRYSYPGTIIAFRLFFLLSSFFRRCSVEWKTPPICHPLPPLAAVKPLISKHASIFPPASDIPPPLTPQFPLDKGSSRHCHTFSAKCYCYSKWWLAPLPSSHLLLLSCLLPLQVTWPCPRPSGRKLELIFVLVVAFFFLAWPFSQRRRKLLSLCLFPPLIISDLFSMTSDSSRALLPCSSTSLLATIDICCRQVSATPRRQLLLPLLLLLRHQQKLGFHGRKKTTLPLNPFPSRFATFSPCIMLPRRVHQVLSTHNS